MKKIALSGKKGAGKYALVDDEDYYRFSSEKWHVDGSGYAAHIYHVRMEGRKSIRRYVWMHRVIAATPDGMQTDHINHNQLDNRKENLRICTSRENQYNTRRVPGASGFRGVKADGKKWRAMIKIDGKYQHIGMYQTPEEAALAWNEVAKETRGAFAILNVINPKK